MTLRTPPTRPRRGLSLLEVLVALAIFLFALVGIGRLIVWGSDRALDVQYKTQAAQLCQAKMAEVIAGAVPLSSQNDAPFDEDPDWHWSLDAEQGSISGLWTLTVKVTRQGKGNDPLEVTLSQMILDPSLRGSAMDTIVSNSTSDTGSGDSSGSGGGSSSQTGGQQGAQGAGAAGAAGGQSKGGTATPGAASGPTRSATPAPAPSTPTRSTSPAPSAPSTPSTPTRSTTPTRSGSGKGG
jgi:general secretion pathway protein I